MTAEALRQPPQSIEAEQSVLGGLLLDNRAWAQIADVITDRDFYRADHRTIFQHIAQLIENGEPADALTVAESLERSGRLEEVGGRAYIGSLASSIVSVANVRNYAEIVREQSQRREIAAIGLDLHDKASAPGADAVALRCEAEKRLTSIVPIDGASRGDWPVALDLEILAEREPELPRFIIDDWLPCGYATLLAGHGGVGKSAIALHLAVCIAAGLPFFGLQAERRRVLYLSCEDRESVLHWRLSRICAHLSLDLASLRGWLEIIDLVGGDAILWERDPRTGNAITPAYGRLQARMNDRQTQVLMVDGISDSFAGNENARTEVKRYVNGLVAAIPPDTGAVLLVGHVAKPSSTAGANGDGYSGSTGWHNSVRARWYLYPEATQGEDGERNERTGDLILELQKSNLGRTDQSMRFAWDQGAHLFLGREVMGATLFDRTQRDKAERQGILAALKACAGSVPAIVVPAAMQGPRTAYAVLSQRSELPASLRSGKPGKRRFWRQVEALRQIHAIEEVEYRRSNRHVAAQIVLTQEGLRQCAEY